MRYNASGIMGGNDDTVSPWESDAGFENLDSESDSDSDSDPDSHSDTSSPDDDQGNPPFDTDANTAPDLDADLDNETDTNTNTQDDPILPCTAEWMDGRLIHKGDSLVGIDPTCGKLTYGRYANEGQTNKVNILPDFSYAGYMGGGVPIPNVPVVTTLSPAAGDNHRRIQDAIDSVSSRKPNGEGIRGAVLLRAGIYEVSNTLKITAGGVVLRGEGQGDDGTILVATKLEQHNFLVIAGAGSGFKEVSGSRVKITSKYVPVGAKTFEVESTDGFLEGDTIAVVRTPNQKWINALSMAQWNWTPDGYEVEHERTIEAIHGKSITVNIPIVDTMEEQFGGGSVFLADLSNRIEQCGVEDIRLDSKYRNATDEAHGWNAITLQRTTNSWVRRVTAVHFGYSAVTISGESSFNTVEETAQLDPISQVTGGRRYSFNISNGVGNLFNRCFARDGRHNFVTGSKVTGPNVWLDCLSVKNNSDEGPHHRWSTGLLFDNVSSKDLHAQNREESGSGHGWAGAQTLFWNAEATGGIICDAPFGAMNWVVGSQGTHKQGSWAPGEPDGIWESHSVFVNPRSLYLSQLKDRLGQGALEAVTIPEQRQGTIWTMLNGWQGNGALENSDDVMPPTCDGILAGNVCCPASCGACGGSGCGGLPGGAENCCAGSITEANRSCEDNPAPCVM